MKDKDYGNSGNGCLKKAGKGDEHETDEKNKVSCRVVIDNCMMGTRFEPTLERDQGKCPAKGKACDGHGDIEEHHHIWQKAVTSVATRGLKQFLLMYHHGPCA
jgi:hypothetical protein